MNTVEMLKKSLAFTLGAAEFSAEKVKQFADDMVSRGEISTDEAKTFVDEVSQRADEEKRSIQDWMRDQATKMLQQAGAVEVARFDRLEQRVAALERKLADTTGATSTGIDTEACIIEPTTGQCVTHPGEHEPPVVTD